MDFFLLHVSSFLYGNLEPQQYKKRNLTRILGQHKYTQPSFSVSVPGSDKDLVCLRCYEMFSPSASIKLPQLTLIETNT